ncbi:restriction endonuclease subunit S [Pseudomonas sp. S5(2021)]|nr:restriction endonuclease subunit S [Pseudomonas sp. S5(2021)]
MTALLTDNLPLLAGAPNGIKKLRELILELAVRGKLVPQDPKDEPANELLKRIAEEKARLVAEGKIKKQKALTERDDEAPAFELPAGWAWARLSDVVNVLNGRAYKKEELLDAGTPVLRVGNLFTSNHWYYSNLTLEEDKYCNPGDLLFAWSASFGPFIWQGERSIYHYHIWKLDFYAKDQLSKHYLYNYLLEQTQEIKAAGHGVSMVHMTKEKMEKLVVPVPPLAEQDRIVAKVDQLMALCDQLEAQQADADSAHTQLVQALLDSLTQARDAEDFAQSWQRLAEHFHTLFTTEPCIDALKQTLLQLAVRGRLVPQIPEEKEAINWLERIKLEKQRLQHNRLRQNVNRATDIEIETPAIEVPESWRWVSLADITLGMDSGWSPACEPTPSPNDSVWGVLKTTAVQVLQYLEGENKELPAHLEPRPDAEVKAGDILFTRAGPTNRVGISCLVESTRPRLMISDKIIRFHPVEVGAYGRYIALCLNTGGTAMYLELAKSGMAASQVNISQEKLKRAPIPFPPLPEQRRIVAKVDQLMALCDQLKARLSQARQVHEHLANALVEQAVA